MKAGGMYRYHCSSNDSNCKSESRFSCRANVSAPICDALGSKRRHQAFVCCLGGKLFIRGRHCRYHGPYEPLTMLYNIYLNVIPSCRPRPRKWSLRSAFPSKMCPCMFYPHVSIALICYNDVRQDKCIMRGFGTIVGV